MSALYLPVLGRLHGASEPAARDLTAATLQAAIILGCGFGIFIALAPISVASVLFGADLADTGTFLRILIAVSPFLLVSFVARLVLTAGALGRVDIRANMIGLGVSIIGGALMLPMFGVRGLMVAYVCGEVTGASFKVRAIARLHGLQWSDLSPVTRVAPILLGAAIWTGAMIESGAGAGARWLVVAMSMTLVLLAAMAFGPWGGREIVAPLRNS